MGFFNGECRERWTIITRHPISDRGARTLDMTLVAPAITLTGAFVGALPKVVRYALVSLGAGFLAWNAFNLIDHGGESPSALHAKRRLNEMRDAGL